MAPNLNVLERGHIYFVYKPKVNQEEVGGVDDVQRFFVILHPESSDLWREIVVGRKRLPSVEEPDKPYWAAVELLTHDTAVLEASLRGDEARGGRVQPPARPAGQGIYEIVRHGRHMHLAFALSLPQEPGEVQEELRIPREASFVVRIKNPLQGENMGTKPAPRYPADVLEGAGNELFFTPDDTRPLDFEGAELLLIPASSAPSRDLGLDLEEGEREESASILSDLRMRQEQYPKAPLFEGHWA